MNYRILKPSWIKLIFSLIYVILLAEVFLRVLFPIPMLPRYINATDFGIRGNMANLNYWHHTPDYDVSIRTNSKGIRANEEIPYKKPENIKRIVVLGDSFAMGYGVNLEDTFLSQMKRDLKSAGYETQIVNLSVSGHGNAEELIVLQNEGLKFDPDIVLLSWHFTDFDDNVRSNLFMLENEKLVRKSQTYLPGVKIREYLFSFTFYRIIAGNSHLYNWLRHEIGILVKRILVLWSGRIIKKSYANQEETELKRKTRELYSLDLMVSLIKAIEKEANSVNADLLILDIPVRQSRFEFGSLFPAKLMSSKEGFHVVSPIKLFKEKVEDGDLIYWEKSHGHFTPKGCRIVGQALAETIITKGLLN